MNIFLVYLYLDILFKNITTYKLAGFLGWKTIWYNCGEYSETKYSISKCNCLSIRYCMAPAIYTF